MNELARAIVLLCQLLEGTFDRDDPKVTELSALYLTLLRRGESAAGYHLRPRGVDNGRALELEGGGDFPEVPPAPLPQKAENR